MLSLSKIVILISLVLTALVSAPLLGRPEEVDYDKHLRVGLFLDKVVSEKPERFVLEGHVGFTIKNRNLLQDRLVALGKSDQADVKALAKGISHFDIGPDQTNSMAHMSLEFSTTHLKDLLDIYYSQKWYDDHKDWKDGKLLFLSEKAGNAIAKKLEDLGSTIDKKEFDKVLTLEKLDEITTYLYRSLMEYRAIYLDNRLKVENPPDQKDTRKKIATLVANFRELKLKAFPKLGFQTTIPVLWGVNLGLDFHHSVESWVTFAEYKKLEDITLF